MGGWGTWDLHWGRGYKGAHGPWGCMGTLGFTSGTWGHT